MSVIGPVFIGVGGVAVCIGYICERYHNARFDEHLATLERLHEHGRDDEIPGELRDFHDDKYVDYAIEGMFWGHVGGIFLLFVGVFLTITPVL